MKIHAFILGFASFTFSSQAVAQATARVREITEVALVARIDADKKAEVGILRTPTRDVILVTANATGQDLADAVQSISSMHRFTLDRPTKAQLVRVRRNEQRKAGRADADRAARWLAKLPTAPLVDFEGLGRVPSVSFSIPYAQPPKAKKADK